MMKKTDERRGERVVGCDRGIASPIRGGPGLGRHYWKRPRRAIVRTVRNIDFVRIQGRTAATTLSLMWLGGNNPPRLTLSLRSHL